MFGSIDKWGWFAAGVVLIVLEMIAPGVFLFWLGLAAFAVGFMHLALLGLGVALSMAAHLVLFAILSVIAVAIGRLLSRRAEHEAPVLNQRANRLIGRTFALESAIGNGFGSIRIDDSVWRVAGPDLPAGARVTITAVDGASLSVRAA